MDARRRTFRRRRVISAVLLVLAIFVVWNGISLTGALLNPANGTSFSARFAEWARAHGGSSITNWIENEWYAHHPPPVGGKPPKGAISTPTATAVPVHNAPAHLPPPSRLWTLATPALVGEGEWSPSGRLVGGIPAVYETRLRPDNVHTSEVVGVAWMDTKLLRAALYSGSQIPGGGPFTLTAPVQPAAANSLVAGFNAGFLMSNANGGYYTDGRTLFPLRTGAASFVIYKNGSVAIGQWGRDVTMTPQVVSVRENLDLLVDQGHPVPGLNANDTSKWGATLGNHVYVWRSGVGITASGALIYVGGPAMSITSLANVLADAGAVRAMELDINTDWVNLATYSPTPPQVQAAPANGVDLLPTMAGSPSRYFTSWWARDFFTMSAR
ncbi:MAG TPA: phosphodiester glycosidase family protein [Acidimicrobiales bacterium]|nr:phosphodiester glycosidase family protein [Acidimicrobiales bacterium]